MLSDVLILAMWPKWVHKQLQCTTVEHYYCKRLVFKYTLFYMQHFYKQRQAQIWKKKKKPAKKHPKAKILTKMSKKTIVSL